MIVEKQLLTRHGIEALPIGCEPQCTSHSAGGGASGAEARLEREGRTSVTHASLPLGRRHRLGEVAGGYDRSAARKVVEKQPVYGNQMCLRKDGEQCPQVIVASIGSVAVNRGLASHGIGNQARGHPIHLIVRASVTSYTCRAAQH